MKIVRFLLGVVCSLLITGVEYAHAQNPYRGTIEIHGLGPSTLPLRQVLPPSGLQTIAPIALRLNLYQDHELAIVFDKEKTYEFTAGSSDRTRFFQGYLVPKRRVSRRTEKVTLGASAMLEGDRLTIFLSVPHRSLLGENTEYKVTTGRLRGDGKSAVRVSRSSRAANLAKTCAESIVGPGQRVARSTERLRRSTKVSALEMTRILYVRPFGDAEFLGGRSVAEGINEILSILNAAEANAFGEQLGLAVQVAESPVLFSLNPPTMQVTNPSALLQAFRSYSAGLPPVPGKTGVSHLFTRKDLDGQTVGIAYLNSACNSYFNVGVTQVYGSTAARIFSHEVAHNIGLLHFNDSGIMHPSVTSSWSWNSALSVAIGIIKAKDHTICLPYLPTVPTPTPTATNTAVAEPTLTPTALPTETPRQQPTETPRPTSTPAPTATPQPTQTPRPTETPKPTATSRPEPTVTPLPTSTPRPTETPRPTATTVPTIVPTQKPQPTVVPSPSPRPTVAPIPGPGRFVVSGRTLSEDGTAVRARVWAWGTTPQGQAVQRATASNEKGEFSFGEFPAGGKYRVLVFALNRRFEPPYVSFVLEENVFLTFKARDRNSDGK